MITVLCGVLFFLLLIIFFYYRNSLNKEKENCVVKLNEKDIYNHQQKISYEVKLNEKDIYNHQQKISYEDKLDKEKNLCNNEKDILNVKLNNIYTTIDNIINNLSNNEKLVYEIENLRQLRTQAQVISSIIPSTASLEEIRRKINTIETNINNKITQRENDTIDPLSQEIGDIINNFLSIFIEQKCKVIDSNGYKNEKIEYNEKIESNNIICNDSCNGYIKNEFLTSNNLDMINIYDKNGKNVKDLCFKFEGKCIPREDLVLNGYKNVRINFDQTNFELFISNLENLRDTLPPEEHKYASEEFLNMSNRFFKENTSHTNDMIDVASVFLSGFIEFSRLNRPVKINYNKLIKYLRDTKEKFCNPAIQKDYKVYVTNFVDNIYDSYMKTN